MFSFVSFVCSPSLKDPQDHKEGARISSQQRNSVELPRNVPGPTAGENVETSGLHRGTAVG